MLSVVREWSVPCVFLLIACAPSAGIGKALAEEPVEPEPVVQAEEVVVSATKTPLPVSQVTSAVEVITEQDMKKQNIRSVVDALRLAQGLAVFSSGGPG
ncbi:MAG: TonB-dependent receptor plug domain-containing protein, partial [Nitrospira sp.]